MISLGLVSQTFYLAREVLHARGLLEASDMDPILKKNLLSTLIEKGDKYGSSPIKLGIEFLSLLENQGRISDILDIGKGIPHILLEFVEVIEIFLKYNIYINS